MMQELGLEKGSVAQSGVDEGRKNIHFSTGAGDGE
jgi:hypothetical protein